MGGLQKLITDLDMRYGKVAFASLCEQHKGGVYVYEAYEVKKKGKNYAVFCFAGFFFKFFWL
jgi:hypothetical protein